VLDATSVSQLTESHKTVRADTHSKVSVAQTYSTSKRSANLQKVENSLYQDWREVFDDDDNNNNFVMKIYGGCTWESLL
jgi:hypothetical protein